MMKQTEGENEERCDGERESGPGCNACCECKEGGVFGGSVYCSIDGRFHPKRDNLACRSFIRCEKRITTASKIKETKAPGEEK